MPQRNKRRTLTTVENHVKLLEFEDLCKPATWEFDEPLLLSIVYEHNIYYQTQGALSDFLFLMVYKPEYLMLLAMNL